jgi:Ca2+-binding RTX toxin-like protein
MAFIRGTNGNDQGAFALIGTNASDSMNGFGGDDDLFGNGGNDNMHGDAGDDELFGGEGNDSLDGGLDEAPTANVSDSDLLDGGNGIDTATYAQVQHGVDVDLGSGFAFGGGNIDRLVSIENLTGTNFADELVGDGGDNGIQGADGSDTIDGGGGNDRLSSNGGNDTLNGGANTDTLIGSLGADKLTGGTGADLFQYFGFTTLTSPGDSGVGLGKRDVIGDFVKGADKIDLHFADAKTSAGNLGNQDFSFIGGNALSAEGQVRVFTEGSNTIVQGSNDADLLPEFEIQLTGVVKLNAADFIL